MYCITIPSFFNVTLHCMLELTKSMPDAVTGDLDFC